MAAIALLHNVFFAWRVGIGGFTHLRLEGKYEVGVRYLRTQVLGTEVTLFYPVDGGKDYEKKMREKP